jgi:hypothetical protein
MNVDGRVCCRASEDASTFCSKQCVLPLPNNCVCIDSDTGRRVLEFQFFADGVIDCINVVPPTIPPVTECMLYIACNNRTTY